MLVKLKSTGVPPKLDEILKRVAPAKVAIAIDVGLNTAPLANDKVVLAMDALRYA